MPGPLYSRYVPSTDAATSHTLQHNGSSSTPTKKAKKSEQMKEKKIKEPKVARNKSKKRKLNENDTPEQQEDDENQRSKRQEAVFAKFQKSTKIAERLKEKGEKQDEPELDEGGKESEPEPVLHGLVPLPQPEPQPESAYRPNFSSLPSWLEKPIIVDDTARRPFKELGLNTKVLGNLDKRKLDEAFPIQAAMLPLLLPGVQQWPGDICVSAPTGSGKTLSYILPLVESLKDREFTQLKAVVVVPTRELVSQARQEAEQCAAGSKIHIGTAVGSTSLHVEQKLLVAQDQILDKQAAAELHTGLQKAFETGFFEEDQLNDDLAWLMPNHVPIYRSEVDLLICTPGRLVEHIKTTKGFSLKDLKYLVIDEADRLLDDSFQEWVDVILAASSQSEPQSLFVETQSLQEPRHIQKMILSATMTRDLGKLAALKLQRPILVAVSAEVRTATEAENDAPYPMGSIAEMVELPSTLREMAIAVGEGTEKPPYLLQLLDQELGFSSDVKTKVQVSSSKSTHEDSDSSSSSSSEDSSYEDSSDSDSDSEVSSSSSDFSSSSEESAHQDHENKSNAMVDNSKPPRRQVLVFTNQNEDAMRLSHILAKMRPQLASQIGTLTKTSSKSGRKTLASFKSGRISILIASDRASRGLDVPNLTDVVGYDIPRSQTVYVHRVGRTARAGRSGTAWSFFTKTEGRWFWNAIARADDIRRGQNNKVERHRLELPYSTEMQSQYEAALASLKSAVMGT